MGTKLHRVGGGQVAFMCPACKTNHVITGEGGGWRIFDIDSATPTVEPSVLVYAHDAAPPFKPQPRCHLFIRNGRIFYQGDCDHAMANQTVDLPDWPAT